MRILRHAQDAAAPAAVAIGSFDGVHLGHAAVIAAAKDSAREAGIMSTVLTFEPLPRELLNPGNAPPRLTSLTERLALLARLGPDLACVQRFDAAYAALSAEEFERRLAERHGARVVLVGEDFRYGARRTGDRARLERAGRELGFEVRTLPAVTVDGARVSSTRIREALAAADFDAAARQLGRRYAICGRVVRGARRGRTLGFPTANVRLARARTPLSGIFAVKCHGVATRGLEGVASLGINPAVRTDGVSTLEAFLFDFSGDLYGRRISIEFLKKLRDEAPFASMQELAAQIGRDCDAAREYFREQAR